MRNRFFIQIVAVALFSITAASVYYYHVCNALNKTNEGPTGKLNHILHNTTHYDAVFMGSSRVLRNINPLLFDSLTGILSYNAGIDGANFTLIDILTRRFIEQHKPKYIFINLDPYTMERDSEVFYYPQFYPHIHDVGMNELAFIEPSLLLGNRYPFIAISYMDDNLKGEATATSFSAENNNDVMLNHRGFEPLLNPDYHGSTDTFSLTLSCDKNAFKKLDSLCAYCTAQHCKVFFMMAPICRATNEHGQNIEIYYSELRNIEARYNISEFNFYDRPGFTKAMFFNQTHINQAGAIVYTRLLADTFNKANH